MSTNKHTCDRCGAADTTVHLTQVIDGKVTKLHLCEACAAAAGIDMEKTISITDILLGLDGEEQPAAAAAEVDVVCPACGISRSEYRKRGRLGCPECYHSFRRDLMPVIKSMQQGVKHRGRRPVVHAPEREKSDLASLRVQLQEAVAAENYERAVELRDAIQLQERKDGQHE